MFSGDSLWWSVIFVKRQANYQWSFSFCPPLQISSFLTSSVMFWVAVFESTFGRLLLEQYFSFRGLVVKLRCMFLPYWTIIHDYYNNSLYIQYIIIHDCTLLLYLLYHCYVVIFCRWSLYFVLWEKQSINQLNKQTNRNFFFGK